MSSTRRKTKEEFIEDARKVWGNQYDYSQVNYVNNKTKVIIRCIKHNETFEQRPFDHVVMKQRRCPQCQAEIKEKVRKKRATGTEEFIKRAKERFGDNFDYSEVEYVNSNTPVKIRCVKGGHGAFLMRPHTHLISVYGCRKCAFEHQNDNAKISDTEFLTRAKRKFGNKFDYSQMTYTDYNSPVKLVCREHGELETTPFLHLLYPSGGCSGCRKELQWSSIRKMTTEEFIERATAIHGDRYDYSETKYMSVNKDLSIKCPRHNVCFEMRPMFHLKGKGCPLCEQEEIAMYEESKNAAIQWRSDYRKKQAEKKKRSKEILKGRPHIKYTWDEFVHYANLIHEGEYDYRYVEKEFVDMNTHVTIICKRHKKPFPQTPVKHLKGQGCPRCIGRMRTTESFIEEAQEVHKGRYKYDKVKFVDNTTPVTITCKIHGDFPMRPIKHLRGEGCPSCQTSKMELEVVAYLQSHSSMKIELQKHFEWLRFQERMSLDVYLPEYKTAIECQGEQHFISRPAFGGAEAFKVQLERDKVKNELCKKHGIQVLYYTRNNGSHLPHEYLGPIFTSTKKLIEEIQKHSKSNS